MWGLIREHFLLPFWYCPLLVPTSAFTRYPFLLEEGALKTSVAMILGFHLRRVTSGRAVVSPSFYERGGSVSREAVWGAAMVGRVL